MSIATRIAGSQVQRAAGGHQVWHERLVSIVWNVGSRAPYLEAFDTAGMSVSIQPEIKLFVHRLIADEGCRSEASRKLGSTGFCRPRRKPLIP